MSLDLPLIWAGLIAVGVLLYVLLDGFDLGVGILFPFSRNKQDCASPWPWARPASWP